MTLPQLIDALDTRRQALLRELDGLSPESLQVRRHPDRWSILEIAEHVVVAERIILQGLPPQAELVARPRTLRHRCLYQLVMAILRLGIPVKVPTKRMLPTGKLTLDEVKREWDAHLRWLRDLVAGLPPEDLAKAWFVHPVAGPITLVQALRMDQVHLDSHIRQIRRLSSGGATP